MLKDTMFGDKIMFEDEDTQVSKIQRCSKIKMQSSAKTIMLKNEDAMFGDTIMIEDTRFGDAIMIEDTGFRDTKMLEDIQG